MSELTPRERELVALGAAMGSNCVPCVEYHIPESRKVGLTDPEIQAAIQYADKVRQVPASKTLQTALKLLSTAPGDVQNAGTGEGCGCGAKRRSSCTILRGFQQSRPPRYAIAPWPRPRSESIVHGFGWQVLFVHVKPPRHWVSYVQEPTPPVLGLHWCVIASQVKPA